MTLEGWLFFCFVWAMATAPIGPNVINCMATSTQQGFRHSLITLPGIGLAALLHILLGLSGLAALLLAYPLLFEIVRYAGAGYIGYMAYKMWRDKGQGISLETPTTKHPLKTLRQAFWISFSNPKAILVNVAIFSQFIDPTQDLSAQLWILLPTALLIDGAIYGAYCALGGTLKKYLSTPARQIVFNKMTAIAYLAIAVGFLSYEPNGSE